MYRTRAMPPTLAKARRALLEEGGDALAPRRARRRVGDRARLLCELLSELAPPRRAQQPLDGPVRGRGTVREPPREHLGLGVERVVGDDARDQSELVRAGGIQALVEQHELRRATRTDEPRKRPARAAVG